MRLFYLINNKGIEWDLNTTKSFFRDPSGFGFEKDNDYEQSGNVFIITSSYFKQPAPRGVIKFDGYETYNDFAKFVQYEPLRMKYVATGTRYIDCVIESLAKTELNDVGWLECAIRFNGLSTYYKEMKLVNENNKGPGKTYSYVYPYVYNDFKSGSIQMINDTAVQSGVRLHIFGPCTNPSWGQFLNGVKIRTGKLNGDIEDGYKLIVDTTAIPYSFIKTDLENQLIADMYSSGDFTTDRFILLESGHNVISVTHEGATDLNIAMEGRIYYAAV